MNDKRKTNNNPKENKEYLVQRQDSSMVNEPEAVYRIKTPIDLFDKSGNRQYYTVEEFMENLRVAVNEDFGYEVI